MMKATGPVSSKGPARTEAAKWAGDVKATAVALELGVKALQAAVSAENSLLADSSGASIKQCAEALTTILAQRPAAARLSPDDVRMLDDANRAITASIPAFRAAKLEADAWRLPADAVPFDGFMPSIGAAATLLAAARTRGQTLYGRHGGVLMIAHPGDNVQTVSASHREAFQTLKDPMWGPAGTLAAITLEETVRVTIEAAEKTVPRSIDVLLAELEPHIDGWHRKTVLDAGFAQLTHPGEMRSLIAHVFENPFLRFPSEELTREHVADTIKLAAAPGSRHLLRIRRGFEAVWLQALKDVLDQQATAP